MARKPKVVKFEVELSKWELSEEEIRVECARRDAIEYYLIHYFVTDPMTFRLEIHARFWQSLSDNQKWLAVKHRSTFDSMEAAVAAKERATLIRYEFS
jgi:hypothetical protein